MCYTLEDGTAYAQQAQKHFYYPQPDAKGAVPFDIDKADGQRLTFYLLGSCGHIYVAEKIVEKSLENPEIIETNAKEANGNDI